jgi:hypothetical protein
MNCPNCNSPDTRKFSVIYQSGTAIGDFSGGVIGTSRQGLSGGVFLGGTRNQTLLAHRVTPPCAVGNAPGCFVSLFTAFSTLFFIFALLSGIMPLTNQNRCKSLIGTV